MIPGLAERLLTTLFADNTTVFLSALDRFDDLEAILAGWCKAARAKFNAAKTEIIPFGKPEYRKQVAVHRALAYPSNVLPENVKVLKDGEATRSLGAWIGSSFEQSAPWDKVIETIKGNLERWDKRNPTLSGRRLVVNMEVGGRTQYLARVQGMPKTVEDRLARVTAQFMWSGGKPRVDKSTMSRRLNKGGLQMLDIRVRNDAIDLMWLKSYLDLSPARPRWAFVADALFARALAATSRNIEPSALVNTFL